MPLKQWTVLYFILSEASSQFYKLLRSRKTWVVFFRFSNSWNEFSSFSPPCDPGPFLYFFFFFTQTRRRVRVSPMLYNLFVMYLEKRDVLVMLFQGRLHWKIPWFIWIIHEAEIPALGPKYLSWSQSLSKKAQILASLLKSQPQSSDLEWEENQPWGPNQSLADPIQAMKLKTWSLGTNRAPKPPTSKSK